MEELEGFNADERMNLLNAMDQISERLSDCMNDYKRTSKDVPQMRKDCLLTIQKLEDDVRAMAKDYRREIYREITDFLEQAKEMTHKTMDLWVKEWPELIAKMDQFELDIHKGE